MVSLQAIKQRVPSSFKAGVRKILNHGKLSFGSQFERRVFRVIFASKEHSLDRIRGLEESKDSAWMGLEEIGYGLVRQFRPKVVVELGTHMGFSALAMGAALRKNGDGGQLFAVDTWMGDEHAGFYGDQIYNQLTRRVDEFELNSTINLLRMRFDEALHQVPTPIDLLHIDGLHTWDAVKHDWETFSTLVRPGGVVIFHDVESQWVDVKRFWETLRPRYPTVTIRHSNGLGILEMTPRTSS